MSAAIKATTVLSGLALVGAASAFTIRNSAQDFSRNALTASELAVAAPAKEKLPSNFLQFSIGQYKWSNAGM